MARVDTEREDLLREATALVERVELCLPDRDESLVAGFRRDGSASFFFGPDPVYQFNSRGQLRRAFVRGLLYKADQGHLYEMRRERTETEVQLVSRPLSEEETTAFLADARMHLVILHAALSTGRFNLVGQVPENGEVGSQLATWLGAVPAEISIARGPKAG